MKSILGVVRESQELTERISQINKEKLRVYSLTLNSENEL